VISVFVLGLSSLSVNATGHKNEDHNANATHENAKGHDNQQTKMKKRLHRLAKKLDLTTEQKSEIKVIFAGMKEIRQTKKRALSGFKEQIQSLLQASEFDENKFANIYTEFQPIFQKSAMEKAKTRHAVLQILTPEQQKKFLTMRKHR